MRLMRANVDGSNIETLVDASQGDPRPGPDPTKWCVGVAIDIDRDQVYWTQKGADNAGKGRLFRAGIEIPTGQTASDRADIELLYEGLPEPIDLELDLNSRVIYWTDRGDPPLGNTVNRAPMDSDVQGRRPAPEIIFTHLMEGIGIALDLKGDRMFITDFGGNVFSANLDGSSPKVLLVAQGNLTGVAYCEICWIQRPRHVIRQTNSSCCSGRYGSDRRVGDLTDTRAEAFYAISWKLSKCFWPHVLAVLTRERLSASGS